MWCFYYPNADRAIYRRLIYQLKQRLPLEDSVEIFKIDYSKFATYSEMDFYIYGKNTYNLKPVSIFKFIQKY